MIPRRRFLAISCAALATPATAASPARWQGIALGAEVSIEISAPHEVAVPALREARRLIAHVEHLFSIYDPKSDLARLNRDGILRDPHPDFLTLCDHATDMHRLTGGLFDPTVQTLWLALHDGTPLTTARQKIGWHHITHDASSIRLLPGQQLTFNGIAQGFATDLVTNHLRAADFTNLHVNIGEQTAYGPPRRLGVFDPANGFLGTLTLENNAVATSSPQATIVGGLPHIFSPTGTAQQWSTVSVIAPSATLADGLSTALCLADWPTAQHIHQRSGATRTVLADVNGDIRSIP